MYWFDLCLSGCKQSILVRDKASDNFNLNCGVPQGSCKGPVLFTLYMSHLFNIVSQHLPSVHGYADDFQIDSISPFDHVRFIRKLMLFLLLKSALLMSAPGLLEIV